MIATIYCPACGESCVYDEVDELPIAPGAQLKVTCKCGTNLTVRFQFECQELDDSDNDEERETNP